MREVPGVEIFNVCVNRNNNLKPAFINDSNQIKSD